MGKLFMILLISSAIILYGTNHVTLFWIAVVNASVFTIVGSIIPIWIATPVMKQRSAMIKDAEARGLSDEEIKAINDQDIPVTKEHEDAVPQILYHINSVIAILGVGLLITGLVIRFLF